MSPLLCGFRKDFSTQHALSHLLEEWKISLDSEGKVGATFLGLSKAFDCLRHDLLIGQLEAYGLSHGALAFRYNYLQWQTTNCKYQWFLQLLGKNNCGCPTGLCPWTDVLQYISK